MEELKKCENCGDTVPTGHKLCWCCEHGHKLHPMEGKPGCEEKDYCEIKFEEKGK